VEYATLQNLAYLLAAIAFIFGLKGLTHPRTAVRGNLTGSAGMAIAVAATVWFLWYTGKIEWPWIIAGVLIGSVAGVIMALKVPMTGMPQMVGLFNGFGGGASFLVAGAELAVTSTALRATAEANEAAAAGADHGAMLTFSVATAAAGLIGSVTLFGSLVAAGKLKEITFTIGGKKYWLSSSILLPGRHLLNALLFLVAIILCVTVVRYPDTNVWYWLLVAVSAVLGILITIPIGGADMPVVIALLNSYSGLAACATGFVISNNVLIIAGSLVGASGLTQRHRPVGRRRL